MSYTQNALKIALYTALSYTIAYSAQLVDIYWVSQLGQGAPTAIAIVASLFFLILTLNELVGVSSVPLLTQAHGRGDKEHTGYLMLQVILAKVIIGLLAALIFTLAIRNALPYYTQDPTIIRYVQEYAPIIALALIVTCPYYSMHTILRTIGQAHHTAWLSAITLTTNITLTPLLVFGYAISDSIALPALGIKGAAIATVSAETIGLLAASALLLNNHEGIQIFAKRHLKLNKKLYKNLLLIGLPIGIADSLYSLENTVLTAVLTQYPTDVSDAYGIGARITGLLFMAVFGISVGAAITTGTYLGKNDIPAIKQGFPKFALIAASLMGLLCLLISFLATPLLSQFTDNPITLQTSITYLRYTLVTTTIFTLLYSISGVFQGAGKNIPVLIGLSTMYLLIEFPLIGLTYYFFKPDLTTLWTIVILSTTLGTLLMAYLYKRGSWYQAKANFN